MSELIAKPELEEIPAIRKIQIFVRIKKSSKYYHQGLTDPTDPESKPQFFKLDYFTPGRSMALQEDGYFLHFNNNAYRLIDCELFLRSEKDAKHFLRIR
ncbi:MAG TPA: hypothetical protein VEH04_11435 [Verrucomicrobiae bacterium]|nr:hypothetical protein [Verrucomicrobiae bacterium]